MEPVLTNPATSSRSRRVSFETHRVGGLFVASYHLRGVDDLHSRGIVLLAFQAFANCRFVARQDQGEVGEGGKGSDSTVNVGVRAVVSAKAVEDNLNHRAYARVFT